MKQSESEEQIADVMNRSIEINATVQHCLGLIETLQFANELQRVTLALAQSDNARLRAMLDRFALRGNWDSDSVDFAGDPVVIWLGYDEDPWTLAQDALKGGDR